MADQKKTVATPSDVVKAAQDDLDMVRALIGGTKAMRAAGERYLPMWPKEEPESYRMRLRTSTLYPAYGRTISQLTGKPFFKPITYGDDIPSQIKDWLSLNADLQGRNLDSFAADIAEVALGCGFCGVLVDYPQVDLNAVKTRADEMATGARPYLVQINPWQILGWKSKRINGVETLTMLRFMESVEVEDGPFDTKMVDQVRVLQPGKWETFSKNDKDEWVLSGAGISAVNGVPLSKIMFVPIYGRRTGFMTYRPPLIEMAHLNLKHWQSQSDQDNILHVARVPMLAISGVDDEKFDLTVGAQSAVKLPTGAAMMFVEHSGAGVAAGRTSLEDLKEEMRQAGAELLVAPGRQTATQVATEANSAMCDLQRITEGIEDAFDTALDMMAEWAGLGEEGGHIQLFKDFGVATLEDASAQILVGMTQSGLLSKKTLLQEVKRRGMLGAEVDPDSELEAAASDGPPLGNMGGEGGPGEHPDKQVDEELIRRLIAEVMAKEKAAE